VRSEYKTSIVLKNSDREISVFLSKDESQKLLDQIYNVFSGEFSDNCIEVLNYDKDHDSVETILLKADEVLYVKSQEVVVSV
jgi:hypothetical protein